MKNKISLTLISLFIGLCFFSCSNEDNWEEIKNQENEIKFKVYTNTPGALVTLSAFYGGTLIIKDYWEGGYTTKQDVTEFTATCEDETVLITGEIYVNGKFRKKQDGNRYLHLIVDKVKRK